MIRVEFWTRRGGRWELLDVRDVESGNGVPWPDDLPVERGQTIAMRVV